MRRIRRIASLAALCLAAAVPAAPQEGADLAAQVRELRSAVDAMREQVAASRRESEELRREIDTLRGRLELAARGVGPATWSADDLATRDRGDILAEEDDLLRAKVDDQEQTKIDSGSKHHVRLSALLLLNVAATRGSVDALDLPSIAQPRPAGESGGSLSAGVRQSQVGLEVFGPVVGGAKTAGDLRFDFFGALPGTTDGVTSPTIRLRTATFALDWKNTSVIAGQDSPFFSPRSPTSLAQTAYPALSTAGNLWSWVPQLHVDHRIALGGSSLLLMQAGVLDPLTGELPAHEYNRVATAGERTRVPAQAVHVGWQRGKEAQLIAVGAGAYHAAQDWGFNRRVDAWAATADWSVSLGPYAGVSGELYRGRAIAGLGGGASPSVLFGGPSDAATSGVVPIESAGGWSQLKITPVRRLELNAAFGEDNPFRSRAKQLLTAGVASASAVNRNASAFLNTIFQARSNLLFSIEYRRLWTTGLDDLAHTADHLSFTTGIGF